MVERKLEGRGKKGRVFTGPEEFIHTHTRGRMQNRKWKKRVERERRYPGGKGKRKAKGPPRKLALDRSSGAVGRKLRLKGKWRATGPER